MSAALKLDEITGAQLIDVLIQSTVTVIGLKGQGVLMITANVFDTMTAKQLGYAFVEKSKRPSVEMNGMKVPILERPN